MPTTLAPGGAPRRSPPPARSLRPGRLVAWIPFGVLLGGLGAGLQAEAAGDGLPDFEERVVDDDVAIGYGVSLGDVDGDGDKDICLVDKKEVVWYRNPDWTRFVMHENTTPLDNVCIAARDIDGDGRVEVAIGAGWNPGDTVDSGSVHYLIPPEDRTREWEAVQLHNEPTVHRMRWVRASGGSYALVVAPLHGRGNVRGRGEGVRLLAYRMPEDPKEEWDLELADGGMHMLHNIDPVAWDDDPEEEILLAGREGVFLCDRGPARWTTRKIAGNVRGGTAFEGCSEVRLGRLPDGGRYIATIEPFHGHQIVVWTPPASGHGIWKRKVLDADLSQGHAVACGDLTGGGFDHLVVGWRGSDNSTGMTGVNIYVPLSPDGARWRRARLDEGGIACEDIRLADLNGDGHLDIVGAGRASHDLKIYWNVGPGES